MQKKWLLAMEGEHAGDPAQPGLDPALLAKLGELFTQLGAHGVSSLTISSAPVGPPGPRQPGYVLLETDRTTGHGIYECDTVDGPPPGEGHGRVGTSGDQGIPPSRGAGLPIYAFDGTDPATIDRVIAQTGGVRRDFDLDGRRV
jgi:hypothetical protein